MKFDFQGSSLLPQNGFVSEIQDCVWEVSQRKIGLTNSCIVHVKKNSSLILSSLTGYAIKTVLNDKGGCLLLWVLWGLVLFPHHPRDFGGLLRGEQQHKGFQALVHDSLKIL